MTDNFCGPCGRLHGDSTNDTCRVAATLLRRSARAKKMASGGTKGEAPVKSAHDDGADHIQLGSTTADDSEDEERLLKEVKMAERKSRMAALRARKAAAVQGLEAAHGTERDDVRAGTSSDRSRERTRKHHKRHRHRHRSSSSSSSSRTPTPERHRRSKWGLKKYTIDKKDVKKLNICELIEATCAWAVDQDSLDLPSAKGIFNHIAYMAGRAATDKFNDSAHVHYDLAIRKKAITEGFEAFKLGDSVYSIVHYSLENLKSKSAAKVKAHTGKSHLFVKEGKRPCYRFNKETGCDRDEERCGYGHWCAKCGSKGHKRSKCHKD